MADEPENLTLRMMRAIDNKLDTRFDILIGKVDEIDNRLTRLESQRH